MKTCATILCLVMCLVGAARAESDQLAKEEREKAIAKIRALFMSEYPINGMSAAELEAFLTEVKQQLGPNTKILSIVFKGPARVEVQTGISSGPLSGTGEVVSFEKKNQKWVETNRGPWRS